MYAATGHATSDAADARHRELSKAAPHLGDARDFYRESEAAHRDSPLLGQHVANWDFAKRSPADGGEGSPILVKSTSAGRTVSVATYAGQ